MCNAVTVGDNCIDNYLDPVRRSFVGGNALNVAVALTENDIPSAYVGPVGQDEKGERIISELKKKGIDVSRVKKIPMKTAVTDVFIDGAERKFIQEKMDIMNYYNIDLETMKYIGQHTLIHNTINGNTIKYLENFKTFDSIVSFDFSNTYDDKILDSILPYIDIAFLSRPDCGYLEIGNLIKKWLNKGPELFIITMGEKGSAAFNNNGEKWFQEAIPVPDLIDTLGAGDAFIGAFLAGWLRKKSVPNLLKKAAEYAHKTCSHYGAWC